MLRGSSFSLIALLVIRRTKWMDVVWRNTRIIQLFSKFWIYTHPWTSKNEHEIWILEHMNNAHQTVPLIKKMDNPKHLYFKCSKLLEALNLLSNYTRLLIHFIYYCIVLQFPDFRCFLLTKTWQSILPCVGYTGQIFPTDNGQSPD